MVIKSLLFILKNNKLSAYFSSVLFGGFSKNLYFCIG